MPALHVSSSTRKALEALSSAAPSSLPPKLAARLAQALEGGDAVVQPASSSDQPPPGSLPSALLVDVSEWTRTHVADEGDELDLRNYTLAKLLKGAKLAHKERPKPVRSPELEAPLAKIRLAQEKAEYERMISPYPAAPAYVSVAAGRGAGSAAPKLTAAQEREAWDDIRRAMSALLNVVISTGAVGTATWWAAGTAPVAFKTLTTLFVCAVVAIAETVLYARHFSNVEQRKKFEAAKGGLKPPGQAKTGAAARRRNQLQASITVIEENK